MAELLPIGHEFWTSWQQNCESTDDRERRYLYRVIGHRQCARFTGDTKGEMLAQLECLKVEYRESPLRAILY